MPPGNDVSRLCVGLLVLGVFVQGAAAADMTTEAVVDLLRGASEKNPPDFSGKDLSRLDLAGADFKRANLAGANLAGEKLDGEIGVRKSRSLNSSQITISY